MILLVQLPQVHLLIEKRTARALFTVSGQGAPIKPREKLCSLQYPAVWATAGRPGFYI